MILFPGRHLMGVLECHQLTPLNKMVELKTHKLWCQYNGCTHCVNSNNSSRENYSSHQTLYVLTLTLNKKQKMKIMGRVARLILLVVVSVCVVFCVLCCLQNNPVFSSVTYLIFQKMKIMSYVFRRVSSLRPEKKGLVVCLAGARSLLRPKKKRYSRLSGGCAIIITTGEKKIQSSVWRVVLLCQFLVLVGNW